jgi:amidase
MLSFLEQYDVIVCPPSAHIALPHGTSSDHFRGFSYTMTYNLTGWPGGVVRAGTSSDGLPIGVQVVGRPWREDVVLAVLKHVENTFGGWQPPML